MQKIGLDKLVEDFKIIFNRFYEHLKFGEDKPYVENFKKELKAMGGQLSAEMVVTVYLPNKEVQTQKYDIEEATFDGIDLPEDVEAFEVSFDVESVVKSGNVASGEKKTLFKSKKFIVKENAKAPIKTNSEEHIVIKDLEMYSDKTASKIRFGKTNNVEL